MNIPQHRSLTNPSARDGFSASGLCQCDILWSTRVRHSETPMVTAIAAKVILDKSKYDSTTNSLRELHWLPVKTRIDSKILTYYTNVCMARNQTILSTY